MSATMIWVRPPSAVGAEIARYGDRVQVAILAVAEYIAQKMQSDARNNAPWTDRTGNARSGLFSVAKRAARDVVEVYISHGHTIEYGVFLELSRGGRYAILLPTLQRNLPELERMLNGIFRG